jgi:hypothetical protein
MQKLRNSVTWAIDVLRKSSFNRDPTYLQRRELFMKQDGGYHVM